jgi:hypothetical protein
MKKLFRTMGQGVVAFLWIVKGLLLLLAVGAVVLWPVSRGRQMGVSAERYTAGPVSGEDRWYYAACWDGRAYLDCGWLDAGGDWGLARIRAEVQSGGNGWRWERVSRAYDWNEGFWSSRWAPCAGSSATTTIRTGRPVHAMSRPRSGGSPSPPGRGRWLPLPY